MTNQKAAKIADATFSGVNKMLSTEYPGTQVAVARITTDYDAFHRMPGNRPVEPARVAKLKKSISEYGWLDNPILVNEKMEIIDGQARFEALKALNRPIEYFVSPGLGMTECIVFNSTQTKWTTRDYIQSYAESGDASYTRLITLLHDHPCIPESVVLFVSNHSQNVSSQTIASGQFLLTESQWQQSDDILSWLEQFEPLKQHVPGVWTAFLKAAVFASGLEEVNRDQLLRKCQANIAKVMPANEIREALRSIERMYNHRSSSPVYLETAYDQYLRGKYSWYAKKWGDTRANKKPAGEGNTDGPNRTR